MPSYAELQVATNFSFLEGASHPHELIVRAAELGLSAIAATDRNSLAGIVRAHLAAREAGVKLIVGCRLAFMDGSPDLLCYPQDRAAYGRLCRLLTVGKSDRVFKGANAAPPSWPGLTRPSRDASQKLEFLKLDGRVKPGHDNKSEIPKGECHLRFEDFLRFSEGQIVAVLPPDDAFRSPEKAESFERHLRDAAARLGACVYLAASHRFHGDDAKRLRRLAAIAQAARVPLIATNDVLYHCPSRRRLQDVLTCIRHTCTIDEAGFRLARNAERHLKSAGEMARLFADYPDAIANTAELASRCAFSLKELTYEYPDEIAPDGENPQARLERLTWEGLARRYPQGAPQAVAEQIRHEFALIERHKYAPFFLTVEDIVRFARGEKILHQGRGSAANSAVCYSLGITEVDPARSNLLFERFISDARDEPPDIDVDFEHERREEVIQYVYNRFGRHRAGLCATVICYRTRGAVREVGKALGLSPDVTAALAGSIWGWSEDGVGAEEAAALGLDASDRRLALCLDLSRQLIGFPRHLSQHPGGFLIARSRLDELAPIENASMADRTIVSWDKDDIEALGMLKVDVLALGMLTCLAKGFELLRKAYRVDLTPATVPAEDAAVYAMLSRADSVGVFQVESRAQQTMLPRLKPKCFYDLVIEVAIVRPGPIQGDMVHPYLRRRQGIEKTTFPSEELKGILEKTLGVPLFQEQCMKIAIVAAGFSPSRADELRRAMATFKKVGTIGQFKDDFIGGMIARGYEREFAERCFSQIQGFGTYGFPESHAASFALLVYCSAWLKCHYPDVFAAAILNSQPMGFYAPAQLVRDAREHGVEVRPADVNASDWDHTLEALSEAMRPQKHAHALRLGLRLIAGMRENDGKRIVEARAAGGPFRSPEELMRRAKLGQAAMLTLARADAFGSLELNRRETLWDVAGLEPDELPLTVMAGRAPRVAARGQAPAIQTTDDAPAPWMAASSAAMTQNVIPETPQEPRLVIPETPEALSAIAQQAEASVCNGPGYRQGRFRDDESSGHGRFRDGSVERSQFREDGSGGQRQFRDDERVGKGRFRDERSGLRDDDRAALPPLREEEAVAEDYSVFGLSLRNHPMAFFRPELKAKGMAAAADLKTLRNGKFVKIAGLVLFRQRPGTAKGTIFVTIEDETGAANLIVWPKVAEAHRRAVFGAKAIFCEGILQKESNVIHVVSRRLDDWTSILRRLKPEASAFDLRFGRGDEAGHASRGGGTLPSKVKLNWTDTLKSRDFR